MENTKNNTVHRAFERLAYTNIGQLRLCLTKGNKNAIQEFIEVVHNKESFFEEIDDLFGGTNDIIIGNCDRYGIPVDTILCMDTGLIRSSPYYNDQAVEIFYKNYYREIYANSFNVSQSPKSVLAASQIAKGVSILSKTAGRLNAESRILDYGCGIGATLIPFKEAGHSVLGLDYGDEYLDYGRSLGIALEQGGLERLEDQEPFDLIILSHVLEHVVQPIQFLKNLTSHLAPGGIIYIEVPGVQWVHGAWNHDLLLQLQNAHVWYFTAHTLRALLSHAGLSAIDEYGSIAVIAKKSEIEPMVPDANHGKNCLRYLKTNEWIFTHGLGSNRISSFLIKKLLNKFSNIYNL